MKKKTAKEQLGEAQTKLWFVLKAFQLDDIMDFVFESLQDNIDYLDGDIENEIDYVKYETDSYSGAKAESRKYIKALKKNKQARLKAMRELRRAYANVKKVKDVQ